MASRKGNWTELGKDKLLSSGLTSAIGESLGMYEVASAALLDSSFEARPALVIPYLDFDKKPMSSHPKWPGFYRIRYLDNPPKGFKDLAGGKARRYAQPGGTGVCAYFPATVDWTSIAANPGDELVITEGELKASAGCENGFPTIGLGGVWSFRASKEGLLFLPELEKIKWAKRTIYVCYDSDYATNPGICSAINSLCEELQERGAIIQVVTIPGAENEKKVGLDDFLLEYGEEEFTKLLERAEPLGLTKVLWQMNREVVYVRNPGMIVVEDDGQKLAPDAFKSHSDWATANAIEGRMSAKGDVVYDKVPAAPLWIRWPLRRAVNRLTYAPGQPKITDANDFNQWPGWGTAPKKGGVEPWLKLTKYLFANAEPGMLDWFYDWCAYPIQNPGIKMFVATLIHGVYQGTGKTLVGYTLGQIYGSNYKEIKDEDLEETYWAENKQFILGDEVSGKDNRQYMNTLKRLITGRTVDINIKFIPQYELPNCINFLFTSQHADSFFLEDNDRRYFVVEVQDPPLDHEFYQTYDRWLWKENGAAALHQWLLDCKIDRKFDPTAAAPKTAAKARMIAATKGDLSSWVNEMMNFPEQTLRLGQMRYSRDLFTAKELLTIYEQDHPASKVTAVGLGRALAGGGCHQVVDGQPIMGPDGKMTRYWAVRNIAQWRKVKNRKELEKHLAMQPVREGKKK